MGQIISIPYNYNGGYGSDEPGKSYMVTVDPCSGSTLSSSNSSISGASISWGAYSDGTYGSNNNCWYHRNAKDPILAGPNLISVAWRQDVFTNAGAGGCFTSSTHAYFTRTSVMTGSSAGSPSSIVAIKDAAYSPNGAIEVINSSSSYDFVALDGNDRSWFASGTDIFGPNPYSFNNGTITDLFFGQDERIHAVSRTGLASQSLRWIQLGCRLDPELQRWRGEDFSG